MGIIWTPTRLETANYCIMGFYLKYELHKKGARLPVYAKGSLLHNVTENFWRNLGTEEEVAKTTSHKKYSNHEGFQKYLDGKWMQRIMASENSEEPIDWVFPEQKWQIRGVLSNLAESLYNHLEEEGPPVFAEIPFKFILDNKEFGGRIDEVRLKDGKVIVRDYKSGRPWLDKTKVEGDIQLTLYNIGVTAICHQEPKLAEMLGLEKKASSYMGNPIFIDPDFQQEFFMMEALPRIAKPEDFPYMSEIPDLTFPTKRNDSHLNELLSMVDGTMNKMAAGDIYPERGRKCTDCDIRLVCEKERLKAGSGILEDRNHQLSLSMNLPAYLGRPKLDHQVGITSHVKEQFKPHNKKREAIQTKLRLRKKRKVKKL